MCELPDAKRVRRENLYDSLSETEANPGQRDGAAAEELQTRLKQHLASLLSFDVKAAPAEAAAQQGDDVDPAPSERESEGEAREKVFDFRLFASRDGASVPSKVILAPAAPAADGLMDVGGAGTGKGGIVKVRPQGYYLAGPPTAEQREQWRLSAVTGEEVIERSSQRCWGLEMPWRVVKLVVPVPAVTGKKPRKQKRREPAVAVAASSCPASEEAPTVGRDDNDAERKKRKRPGKRGRIAIRIKAKAALAAKEKEEELARNRASKEEHLLAKKKRLNREKKLKRRQKEREKKQATAAGTDGGTVAVRGEDDGGSDDASD